MRDRLEDVAIKAVMGVTLALIVGLASVQLWAMEKSEREQAKKK
jgi:hypothetical protein